MLSINDLIPFLTLFGIELALGIDNVISVFVLTAHIQPAKRRLFARRLGIFLAAGGRIGLLFGIVWISKLTNPLFSIYGLDITGRDLIFLGGGGYLIYKGGIELYHFIRRPENYDAGGDSSSLGFVSIICQILLLDLVFSLDSIITAIALTDNFFIMITAILLSVVVMVTFARPVCDFIEAHTDTKIVALLFLVLLGFVLVLASVGISVNHNYLYAGLGFALAVVTISSVRKGLQKK